MILNHVVGKKGGYDLDPRTCDPESKISFTLLISLPDEGSGLNFVDFSTDGKGTDCKTDAEKVYGSLEAWRCHLKNREKYQAGRMVVHAGRLLHSIGEWSYSGYNTSRITMQGFGFRCIREDKDIWYVYW